MENLINDSLDSAKLEAIIFGETLGCGVLSKLLYNYVFDSNASKMINNTLLGLKESANINENYNNLIAFQKEVMRLVSFKNSFEANLIPNQGQFGKIFFENVANESQKICKDINTVIKIVLSIYKILFSIIKEEASVTDRLKLVQKLEELNKKVYKQLDNATQEIERINSNSFSSMEFAVIAEEFKNLTKDINVESLGLVESKEPKVVRYAPKALVPESEQRRLAAIKRANDMFEEFRLDFLRDLEKQYSLSSKDLYEKFINVKFKKFMDRYSFPLSNTVSEGYANDCIAQIIRLMNAVSEISANSYVTSVFQK